jgi:hypothetical protein
MGNAPTTPDPAPSALPANVTATLKQDKPASTSPDWERTARIASLVAIPVVIAIIGGLIQSLGKSKLVLLPIHRTQE